MTSHDRALTPLAVDIDRVICDMNRSFNPLHKDFILDYKVQSTRDGYVLLTIALPEGMTRVFATMLESMGGFFRFMQIKTRANKASKAAVDPDELHRRQQAQTDFKEMVRKLFDGFLSEGYGTRDSIRLTNAALKQKEHPWACHDIIISMLRPMGCLRKNYRARIGLSMSTSQRAES